MVVVAATAALHGEPAHAQMSSQEVQVTAGYMFGDHLQTPLPGSQVRLDDNATVGARYTYYFGDNWGIQVSGAYSPGHAGHVPPNGANNRSLVATDFDLEFDLAPGFELGGRALVPYTVLGMGYAWARQDNPVYGFAGSRPAEIMDTDGYTANVGLGAKYYLGKNVFIGFDARYRYLSRPVSGFGQSLNTEETSLILGYRF